MAQRFVAYLRVSTRRQGDSGLGLEAQREAVGRHCNSVGGELTSEHIEVESGKKNNRPVLAEALAQCRRQKAVLLIAKLDRLARNVAFVSSLMEAGVEFVAADMPFANKFLVHVMAAVAEHEREAISARTKAALAAAKARGVTLGANGANLARLNRGEADRFAETMRVHLMLIVQSGGWTLGGLADQLNDMGHRTSGGARWVPTTTARLLDRIGFERRRNSPSVHLVAVTQR